MAQSGGKWLAVVDGHEGKPYGLVLITFGAAIVFDSPNSLHYLVAGPQDNEISLVVETIT